MRRLHSAPAPQVPERAPHGLLRLQPKVALFKETSLTPLHGRPLASPTLSRLALSPLAFCSASIFVLLLYFLLSYPCYSTPHAHTQAHMYIHTQIVSLSVGIGWCLTLYALCLELLCYMDEEILPESSEDGLRNTHILQTLDFLHLFYFNIS